MKKTILLLMFVLIFQSTVFSYEETVITGEKPCDYELYSSNYNGYSLNNESGYNGDCKKDFSYFTNDVDVTAIKKYNSAENNYVTDVKDQGSYGNCWAFAACSNLETALIKNNYENNSLDLSENHIKNSMVSVTNSPYGYNQIFNKGGTSSMAISYFMNGCGPVLEKDSPYSNAANIEDYGALANYPKLNYSVKSVAALINLEPNDYVGFNDKKQTRLNKVKELICKNGSVAMSIYFNPEYIQGANIYSDVTVSNHAVCVVGWDDEYKKEDFKPINGEYPECDGALIIKNSYGTARGKDGYYYISYCDYHCCDTVYSICDISLKNDSYINNTHTGTYNYNNSIRYNGGTEAYYGNIFNRNYPDEKLEEVSLYMYSGQTYDIYLRKADILNIPIQYSNGKSETVACFKEDTIEDILLYKDFSPEYDGYYTLPTPEGTISLDTPKYAVYVRTETIPTVSDKDPNTLVTEPPFIPVETDATVVDEDGNEAVATNVAVGALESFHSSNNQAKVYFTDGTSYEFYTDPYYSDYESFRVNVEVNAITSSNISKSKINYMSILNENKTKKTTFEKGENVILAPVAKGVNLEGQTLVCGVYDNNKLVKVFTKTINSSEGILETFTYENIPENFSDFTVKAFAIDSLNGITPLGNVKVYE